MRHNVVSSETSGWGTGFKCPGTGRGSSALSVRYETKTSSQEAVYAASWGAIFMVRKQESAEAIVAQRRE